MSQPLLEALTEQGARPLPRDEACARFPEWAIELETHDPIWFVEGTLSVDGLTAGPGWALIVDGVLRAAHDIDLFDPARSYIDSTDAFLVVRGDLVARNLRIGNRIDCHVTGDLRCAGYCFGRRGDGVTVGGTLTARAVLFDRDTWLHAEHIDAFTIGPADGRRPPDLDIDAPDLDRFLVPAALAWSTTPGLPPDLDHDTAWSLATQGASLLTPDARGRLAHRAR